MRQELLEYYERELTYLRQMGGEFAERFPRIANRLLLEADRCEDPHVERLIEAFAFLAARIHLRLDDDLPEITSALLQLTAPHYLRPLPAMSVAECRMEGAGGNPGAATLVPRGTLLTTRRTVDGLACRFHTSYPVELWPVTVAEAQWRPADAIPNPVRVPEAVSVLRLVLRAGKDVTFNSLQMGSLRLYLAGESSVTMPLYELLSRNCIRILARTPGPNSRLVELPPGALRPVGFAEDEALLPYPRRSFDGYRLLQEYFAFPEKFLFFDLHGLEPLRSFEGAAEIELLLYCSRFDRPEREQVLELGVNAATIRLGCTPIINLFEQSAEPILLSQTQHEYRIVPDARFGSMMEIFSVDEVLATSPSRRRTVPLDPLYSFRFETAGGPGRTFWYASRRYSSFGERTPSSMYLSLVDVDGELTEPNAEVLTVSCTCTNHDLPSRLHFNAADGDFEAQGLAIVNRIRALHRPTCSVDPPSGKGQLWRLVSQLSLNHLSLTEDGLPALREILRLHNFSEAPHLQNQIGGLVSLSARPHFASMRSGHSIAPARGTRVELELDERQFVGGGAYLFSAVLDRFLGLYATMNSFCQLSVRSSLRKEMLGEWAPRAGSQVLL